MTKRPSAPSRDSTARILWAAKLSLTRRVLRKAVGAAGEGEDEEDLEGVEAEEGVEAGIATGGTGGIETAAGSPSEIPTFQTGERQAPRFYFLAPRRCVNPRDGL